MILSNRNPALRYTPHVSDARRKIETLLEEVLRPLLQVAEADARLVEMANDRVVFEVSGQAAFGLTSNHLRKQVLERGVKSVGDFEVGYRNAMPKLVRGGTKRSNRVQSAVDASEE